MTHLLIYQCAWCGDIYACCFTGSIISQKVECIDCEKKEGCSIVENFELFDISSGCCDECFEYYYGGSS